MADNNLLVFDATLRDGSHAIKHQLPLETIDHYCTEIDNAGLYTVVVGHGNGLGASSLQVGLSANSDEEMLTTARAKLKNTKLGIYMIPGFGTIEDNLEPAIEIGVDLFKIGCHSTEADITKQHIEYLRNLDKEVYGVLMMSHMPTPERLLEEVKKMESYGALGVILMDSAGAYMPEDVRTKVSMLVDNTNIRIGFHAHNNLGMAVSNTLIALECGATIIDGTIRGFGAGAGNCQIEAVVPVLQRQGKLQGIDFYKLLDVSDEIVRDEIGYKEGLKTTSIVSGLNGVFSAFAVHVQNASERYGVDARDIYKELGKRKVVGGQEDLVVDVAIYLAQQRKKDDSSFVMESLL